MKSIYLVILYITICFSEIPTITKSENEVRLKQLVSEYANSPCWAPDNKGFLYSSPLYLHFHDLKLNKTTNKIFNNDIRPIMGAKFSPDGSRICFWTLTGRSFLDSSIWLMDISGENKTQLTKTGNYCWPDWSPYGDKLVAVSTGGIVGMNAATTPWPPYRLTKNMVARHPRWSPNGDQIVYVGRRKDAKEKNLSLWMVGEDGSGNRRILLAKSGLSIFTPSWSPDQQKIVFSMGTDYGSPSMCLWICDFNGSNLRRLTEPSDKYFDQHPDWSPDGKSILFESSRSGNQGIYLFELPDDIATKRKKYVRSVHQ